MQQSLSTNILLDHSIPEHQERRRKGNRQQKQMQGINCSAARSFKENER